MSQCHVCGNDYKKSFKIIMDNETYEFDSFECAISKLAPRCKRCDCSVIGHGVENEEKIYCSHHCAENK